MLLDSSHPRGREGSLHWGFEACVWLANDVEHLFTADGSFIYCPQRKTYSDAALILKFSCLCTMIRLTGEDWEAGRTHDLST